MRRWLENYGFASLVLLALLSASYLAATVAVPDPAPDFALQAEQIYRLEVGAAFFAVFYLIVMAVVLAFDGRGFAEFGTRGLKAQKVVNQQEALFRQLRLTRRTRKKLDKAHSELKGIREQLASYEKRLEKLEGK